jgi:hypothetical protein
MKSTLLKAKHALSALIFSAAGLTAADLDVTGLNNDVDASVLLHNWAVDIGFTASLSDARKTVFIKDQFDFGLAIKVNPQGLDRIVIYNTFTGKPSNVNSQELLAIVREINLARNVCSAYVDKEGDLVLRYVLGFDDRLTPKLFRYQLDHVKGSTENILKDFQPRLSPYFK